MNDNDCPGCPSTSSKIKNIIRESVATTPDPSEKGVTKRSYNQNRVKSKLTIIETIFHQPTNEQPTDYGSRYQINLATDEKPITRHMKIGPNWVQLDSAWLEDVGMIRISNTEGKHFVVRPTEEEKSLALSKVIEIAMLPILEEEDLEGVPISDYTEPRDMHSPPKIELSPVPFAIVQPGTSSRFEPYCFDCLFLRSVNGIANCTIEMFPA